MIKFFSFMSMISIFVLLTNVPYSESASNLSLKVVQISENVLVISAKTGNARAVALNSSKGIVMVDAFWSPGIARQAREIVQKKFHNKKFIFLINTCEDVLSTGGNEMFIDIPIIGHVNCRAGMAKRIQNQSQHFARIARQFQERVDRTQGQMQNLDPNSNDYKESKWWLDLCQRIADDYSKGYQIAPPNVTFNETMTLDLENMTLELYYFGRAATNGDIIIKVPEEKLLILGDIFHYLHVLPLPESDVEEIDVQKWLEVFDIVLKDSSEIKQVVLANAKDIWDRAKLESRRLLIQAVWEKVLEADSSGLSLDATLEKLNLIETEFPYTKNWEGFSFNNGEIIRSDVKRTARAIWKKFHKSAAAKIEQVLNDVGKEAAIEEYHKLRSDDQRTYYFSESEFNALGYKLMNENKIQNAIEIFKLNVEMYPESANVYDSLGEAYMNDGQKELAIQNYQKSLELNPGNKNAKEMLKKLIGK